LDDYLGVGTVVFEPDGVSFMLSALTPVGSLEERRREELEAVELIAECMGSYGFEYIPVVPDRDREDRFVEAYALPREEFVFRYGYGISTLREPNEAPKPNPNQRIWESLGPAAQLEYERTMFGDPDDDADEGCADRAWSEVQGEPGRSFVDPWTEFAPLLDDIQTLERRLYTQPALDGAREAWSTCVADHGFVALESLAGPHHFVRERLRELEGWDDERNRSGGSSTVRQEPLPLDADELAALQKYEIDLAMADFACQEKHYADAFAAVLSELEGEFVVQHREELEQFRAWRTGESGDT
jgi:hypothetical protein